MSDYKINMHPISSDTFIESLSSDLKINAVHRIVLGMVVKTCEYQHYIFMLDGYRTELTVSDVNPEFIYPTSGTTVVNNLMINLRCYPHPKCLNHHLEPLVGVCLETS